MSSPKNSMQSEHFIESVAYLLRETFEGSPEGLPSAFLDRGIGFFNTLAELNADQVSREFGETTIAAQTEHAKFYLDRLCEFISGRTERVNWEDSWLIETVNDDEWAALQTAMKKAYTSAILCLAGVDSWDAQKAGMAMGLVAHSSYHLGAIRQITKSVKENG